MGKADDGMPGFLRRLAPSETDLATAWKETVAMEDKLSLRAWNKSGAPGKAAAVPPPPSPPKRDELLRFARSQSSSWKAALDDPAAADAMRKVRSRVAELLAQDASEPFRVDQDVAYAHRGDAARACSVNGRPPLASAQPNRHLSCCPAGRRHVLPPSAIR